MKNFEIEVVKFTAQDVVTASPVSTTATTMKPIPTEATTEEEPVE